MPHGAPAAAFDEVGTPPSQALRVQSLPSTGMSSSSIWEVMSPSPSQACWRQSPLSCAMPLLVPLGRCCITQ
jgi:hypothetical protein